MDHTDTITRLRELIPTGELISDLDKLNLSTKYGISQQGHLPICILRPGNVDELASIIQYAGQSNISLTVTSSTGAHRKGGITNQDEHILIDLSRWKKIDLVDRRNRVCRSEPGITYGELIHVLSAHGMTIPMPLSPRNGKSVLAAVMDREPTTWAASTISTGMPRK